MTAADAPPTSGATRTVVHLITTLTQGGAERVLSEVVPRPGEHGEDGVAERHVVVSLAPGGMFADVLRDRGVEVTDLGMRPGRDLVRGVRGLAALSEELRPAMMVGWMYHACLLMLLVSPRLRRTGTRTVWFLQGSLHTLDGLPWHTRATIRLLARTARAADALAINSRVGLAHHADLGYRPRRWVVLPNGCDTTTFRPDATDRAAVRSELGVAADAVVIVAVARTHPQKDHATLLEAVRLARREAPELELVLIGSGTEGLAVAGPGADRVIGLGVRTDVDRVLRGADVLAMSSITEGLPNALLEGMATGLPAVVTDVGDCRAVVGDAGRVVPARDPTALARALVAVTGLGPAERSALGARARHRVVSGHDIAVARREYRALWDPSAARAAAAARPIRVVHVIARMNVGGPARIIAGLLDAADPDVLDQRLITGAVGEGEEDWFDLYGGEDARVVRVPSFGRALAPLADLRTLRLLTTELRRLAPDVVQTHTAKAGLLGRIAARRARVPHVVHTYHGHTLHGYFARPVTALFTRLERRLAMRTDRLLSVGGRVRDELLAAGIGRPDQYGVLPPGISEPPTVDRGRVRAALGIGDDAPVVLFVGRLTGVKRPDRFVAAAHLVAAARPRSVFLVAGDGELATPVAAAIAVGPADVRLLGWRADVGDLLAAADLVVLTSDNEGMPLSLIEAAMAGRACVTTDVGSAGEVVIDGRTGRVVAAEAEAVASAIVELLDDPVRLAAFGDAAGVHARRTYGLDSLVSRVTAVHRELLTTAG